MSEVDDLASLLLQHRGAKRLQAVGRRWAPVLEKVTLTIIVLLAFCIRLFAVIRFEAVIHEFDPHFNWRTTEYLSQNGFVEFWNWFDNFTWYPLGRVVGNTLFPGLMTSATLLNWLLNFCGLKVSVLETCVFFAPLFAGLTAVAAYLLTREVSNRPEAGLFAALFMAICPSYLSRSVAGSYDNEACAIFAIVFSFYAFTMAVKSGSVLWGLFSAFAFLYMVASWGGYIFVLNTIAIYMLLTLLLGSFSARHYVAYSLFYCVGTVLCLNIPFVNFQAISSSEHLASHGVFLVMNAFYGCRFLANHVSKAVVWGALKLAAVAVAATFLVLAAWLTVTGRTNWSGRSLSLLDPTYASKYIPIIASVSEHQPSIWANYVMDLHVLPFLVPVGIFFCFRWRSDASLVLGVYGVVAVYFSGMMIRLLLVLSAAACCLAGVAASEILSTLLPMLRHPATWDGTSVVAAGGAAGGRTTRTNAAVNPHPHPLRTTSRLVVVLGTGFLFYLLKNFVQHCTWMSALAYSSPSVVMSSTDRAGNRVIQDDFREAYYWLRRNTHEKATVASWWDYGYQITSLANRTVIVDNNTWNNTHIATVGLMLGSSEKEAFLILDKLDVDYVLVLSGGVARYSSDDIAKFLWPVRIANGVYPEKIAESDFIGAHGFSVDSAATERFKNSVMYKLCYYRMGEATGGRDFARNQEIGNPRFQLDHFTEAFTTENWIVRIYKVKSPANRSPALNGLNGPPAFPGLVDRNVLKLSTAVEEKMQKMKGSGAAITMGRSGGGGSESKNSVEKKGAEKPKSTTTSSPKFSTSTTSTSASTMISAAKATTAVAQKKQSAAEEKNGSRRKSAADAERGSSGSKKKSGKKKVEVKKKKAEGEAEVPPVPSAQTREALKADEHKGVEQLGGVASRPKLDKKPKSASAKRPGTQGAARETGVPKKGGDNSGRKSSEASGEKRAEARDTDTSIGLTDSAKESVKVAPAPPTDTTRPKATEAKPTGAAQGTLRMETGPRVEKIKVAKGASSRTSQTSTTTTTITVTFAPRVEKIKVAKGASSRTSQTSTTSTTTTTTVTITRKTSGETVSAATIAESPEEADLGDETPAAAKNIETKEIPFGSNSEDKRVRSSRQNRNKPEGAVEKTKEASESKTKTHAAQENAKARANEKEKVAGGNKKKRKKAETKK